jgi:hypothetical protein
MADTGSTVVAQRRTELAQPGIAILESRPRIEGWFKRENELRQLPIRVCRKPRQLADLPKGWTRTIVVADFAADPPGLLASLGQGWSAYRDVRLVVIVPESERSWEWPLRELGATHVVFDHGARQPILRIVRRETGPIPDPLEQALARYSPRGGT